MINRKVIIVVVFLLVGLCLLLLPTTLHSTQDTDSPAVPVVVSVVEAKAPEEPPLATSSAPVSRETPKVKATGSKADYQELVREKAVEYGVSASLMTAIIDCENKGWIASLQSGHHYKKDRPKQGLVAGQREQSYGLVQIHLPDHPNISYEQATNPSFAITFLARELSAGRGRQWSCYSPAVQKLTESDSTRQHTLEEKPEADNLLKEAGTTIDNTLKATSGLAL